MAEKLLDRMRRVLRTGHYSYRTEQAYLHWVRRFIRFHDLRHPRDLGKRHVEAFLTHLAVDRHVAPSTQNLALNAILFLYQRVLDMELPWLDDVVRARRKANMPVVLDRSEIRAVLAELPAPHDRIVALLYGSGLRISEALRLRVKDIDFARRELVIRDGKGAKDRVTVLADSSITAMKVQVEKALAVAALAGMGTPAGAQGRTPPDRPDRSYIFSYLILDAPEKLDPEDIAHAAVFLGNDSGPTHLAAQLGVATVALFGPTDPRRWAPVGPRVTILKPDAPADMDWLGVDGAVEAVLEPLT